MSIVSVATLNLFNNMGRWDERLPLLLDQLAALEPDVIGFQEVNLTTDQGMLLCRLANERLQEPHYRIYHMARPGRGAHSQAQAVMSRLPVEAHEGLDYLLHEDVAQRLRLRLEDGAALDFYNTHLHFPPSAVEQRLAEAERLLAWVDTWQGAAATVVVGDFNAYPDEPTVALLKGRFASAHEAAHGSEPEKTWPTPLNTWDPSPPGCLDYVFVNGARVLEAGLAFATPHTEDGSLFPSDHLGIMAKVDVG
ncbi:MAG: endonuclease/exonuclease/phosphatase family protein [Chloroflexi bacterium]|nr:endonuclease/exonuclease/phosphatase family protein [Chloroflexota bacterium]